VTPGINRAKTWVLIAGLFGLFVAIGAVIGGGQGATIALVLALIFNAAAYWFSGSIAIAATRSKPVTEVEYPELYRIVRELAEADKLPMPQVYVSEMLQPNAFATGRNPKNAKVAVTKGILQILDERELRGVLAHELSHVANRDILVSSIAAAIGTAISYIAFFAFWFGGDDDEGGSPIVGLLAWLVAPLAAGIIQMAVSRSREYQADESGAYLSRDPAALASALLKLEQASKQIPAPTSLKPSEAHMFIVNPLNAARAGGRGGGIAGLFLTHPPTAERIARLEAIRQQLASGAGGTGVGRSPFDR
jgi:heat shock protein HtpX